MIIFAQAREASVANKLILGCPQVNWVSQKKKKKSVHNQKLYFFKFLLNASRDGHDRMSEGREFHKAHCMRVERELI